MIIVLGILCIAHWALLYRTMFIVVSQWDPSVKSCVVVQTDPSILNMTFFYSELSVYVSYFSLLRLISSISHGI